MQEKFPSMVQTGCGGRVSEDVDGADNGSGRNSVDINRATVALVGAAVKRRTPFFDDQRRLPHLQMEEMRTEQSCKFFGGIRLKQKGGTRQDRLGISDFA